MTSVFTRGRAAAVGAALVFLAAGPGCSLFDGCRNGCSSDSKSGSMGSPGVTIPPAPPAAVAGATSPGVYPAALK